MKKNSIYRRAVSLMMVSAIAIGMTPNAAFAEDIDQNVATIEDVAVITDSVKTIAMNVGIDQSQLIYTWYATSSETGYLEICETADLVEGNISAEAGSYVKVEANQRDTTYSGYYSNNATIDGLEAGKEYSYRIGNDAAWSDIFTFDTNQEKDGFTFIVTGDPQIGSSGNVTSDTAGWNTTLTKADDWFSELDFVLSVGDQVNTASNETQYDGFLEQDVLKATPLLVNVGNHENSSELYSAHYTVPTTVDTATVGTSGDQAGDYWCAYEGTLFITLNSTVTSSASHKAYLEQAIEEYTAQYGEPQWKIVTFHHSVYSTASHYDDSDIITRRAELPDIFTELDIDAVLMGHDHVYTRSFLMNGTTPTTDVVSDSGIKNEGDVLYITANSASGSKYYSIDTKYEFDFSAVNNQESTPNITKVDVSDESITFITYRTGSENTINDVVDTFTLYKSSESDDTDTGVTEGFATSLVEVSDNVYNIVIENAEGLEDFLTAEFKVDSINSAFSIAAADGFVAGVKGSSRVISLSGDNTVSGTNLVIGTITLTGEDTLSLADVTVNTNIGNGEFISNVATGTDSISYVAPAVSVEDKTVTIKTAFTNETVAYTDMTVTFKASGEDDVVVALGAQVAQDLEANKEYTVVIAGAGYRTFEQTITLTDDVTINIWNNAADIAANVVVGDDTTAQTVTFLAGDINDDGVINSTDLLAVVGKFGADSVVAGDDNVTYDLNRDGKVDSKDIAMVLVAFGK